MAASGLPRCLGSAISVIVCQIGAVGGAQSPGDSSAPLQEVALVLPSMLF